MKPHKLIEPWKGDKRFTAMAKRAAALKKAGQSAEEIVAAITAEFGPPAQLERLRDAPQPFRVYGEVGADIEARRWRSSSWRCGCRSPSRAR